MYTLITTAIKVSKSVHAIGQYGYLWVANLAEIAELLVQGRRGYARRLNFNLFL